MVSSSLNGLVSASDNRHYYCDRPSSSDTEWDCSYDGSDGSVTFTGSDATQSLTSDTKHMFMECSTTDNSVAYAYDPDFGDKSGYSALCWYDDYDTDTGIVEWACSCNYGGSIRLDTYKCSTTLPDENTRESGSGTRRSRSLVANKPQLHSAAITRLGDTTPKLRGGAGQD